MSIPSFHISSISFIACIIQKCERKNCLYMKQEETSFVKKKKKKKKKVCRADENALQTDSKKA
ncbi:hypothetical protein BsIDN1_33390 [Bacillus safensis]|uniref:Uncharacterized protein n=1 Tax=Bacillus safensis TaxID=561879 RepID=A0A5S9M9Z2_BACIA|nr:hypothetical protein BsIDN1_33390 [Bacillus safensis]